MYKKLITFITVSMVFSFLLSSSTLSDSYGAHTEMLTGEVVNEKNEGTKLAAIKEALANVIPSLDIMISRIDKVSTNRNWIAIEEASEDLSDLIREIERIHAMTKQ